MAFVIQKRFRAFEYAELADETESSVAGSSAGRVFDFFDAVRKGNWKPSGVPIPVSRIDD